MFNGPEFCYNYIQGWYKEYKNCGTVLSVSPNFRLARSVTACFISIVLKSGGAMPRSKKKCDGANHPQVVNVMNVSTCTKYLPNAIFRMRKRNRPRLNESAQ